MRNPSNTDEIRWLRFSYKNPTAGRRVRIGGSLFEFVNGDWWEVPRELYDGELPAIPRKADLFMRYAIEQRNRVTDFRGLLPDQYAVEVIDERGNKRIDYIGVPIRNADGSLNKYGKILIDAHETPNNREKEIASEINYLNQEERAAAGD